MTQIPDYPSPPPFSDPSASQEHVGLPKTSGLAIASLSCGVVGLLTCCALAPSALAAVLGAVSLPAIGRGQARGKGLAVSGIVLGVLGVALGITFWIVMYYSPGNTAIPGRDVREADRRTLEDLGVLLPDESIELFYSGGMLSLREGGALITTERLVLYGSGADIDACDLADIRAIQFAPAGGWFEDGQFVIERDDGETLVFPIGGMDNSDQLFHDALLQHVTRARESAGKSPPEDNVSLGEGG